jgi:hypothetical protein
MKPAHSAHLKKAGVECLARPPHGHPSALRWAEVRPSLPDYVRMRAAIDSKLEQASATGPPTLPRCRVAGLTLE